jgi:hypothetical protein
VRSAQPRDSDEIEYLLGSGRLPAEPCCHRRKFVSELDSVKKERAAASMFKRRCSPHRSLCSRRAEERRPSTEIRLGINPALQRHEPLLAFFIRRSQFASERGPPGGTPDRSIQTTLAFDASCLFR